MDAPDPPIRILLSSYPMRWRVPFTDNELRLALLAIWRSFSGQDERLLPGHPIAGFFVCLSRVPHGPSFTPDNIVNSAGTAPHIFSAGGPLPYLSPRELEVAIMDDAEIALLNEQYLGAPGPTNILAFPSGGGEALGWLALSADTMRREARLYGQPLAPYTLRLLAHGFAHLLGHEHGAVMDEATDLAVTDAVTALSGDGKGRNVFSEEALHLQTTSHRD